MGTWRLIFSHGQYKIPYCAKGSRNVLSLNMKGQFILKIISVGGTRKRRHFLRRV